MLIKALCARPRKMRVNVKGIKWLLKGLDDWQRGDGLFFLLEAEVKIVEGYGMQPRRKRKILGLNMTNFDGTYLSWHEEFHRKLLLTVSGIACSPDCNN